MQKHEPFAGAKVLLFFELCKKKRKIFAYLLKK